MCVYVYMCVYQSELRSILYINTDLHEIVSSSSEGGGRKNEKIILHTRRITELIFDRIYTESASHAVITKWLYAILFMFRITINFRNVKKNIRGFYFVIYSVALRRWIEQYIYKLYLYYYYYNTWFIFFFFFVTRDVYSSQAVKRHITFTSSIIFTSRAFNSTIQCKDYTIRAGIQMLLNTAALLPHDRSSSSEQTTVVCEPFIKNQFLHVCE